MKTPQPESDDQALRRLLCEADPSAELPPRFRESVWHRIEVARREPRENPGWLESLVALLFRPAFATAGLAILMIAGGFLGAQSGRARVEQEAQARYVALVSPLSRVATP
jgi:hypothetical protein